MPRKAKSQLSLLSAYLAGDKVLCFQYDHRAGGVDNFPIHHFLHGLVQGYLDDADTINRPDYIFNYSAKQPPGQIRLTAQTAADQKRGQVKKTGH